MGEIWSREQAAAPVDTLEDGEAMFPIEGTEDENGIPEEQAERILTLRREWFIEPNVQLAFSIAVPVVSSLDNCESVVNEAILMNHCLFNNLERESIVIFRSPPTSKPLPGRVSLSLPTPEVSIEGL